MKKHEKRSAETQTRVPRLPRGTRASEAKPFPKKPEAPFQGVSEWQFSQQTLLQKRSLW